MPARSTLKTTTMADSSTTRRELLSAGLGGAAAIGWMAGVPGAAMAANSAAGAPASPLPASPLPADSAAQNEATVKLYGNTAGGESLFRTRGVIYAVQATGIRALYAMVGSERSWWKRLDATRWVRYPSTLSFFRDLESGEWLQTYANPLNGRSVQLPASYIRHKEGEFYTPSGHYFGSMKQQFPDYYQDEAIKLDWEAVGDTLRLRGSSKFPPILPQPSLECATLFSSVRQILDRRTTRAEAHGAGWNIFAWHPYLEMGDIPGHIIWHFDAVKVGGVADLDPAYVARARAHTPLFDQSPELDEGPTFFERILQRRKAAASG